MDEYNYQLNCGQYVLHLGDKPVGAVMDEVSIAFDRESGTMHKHGKPESVQAWLAQAQKKLRSAGAYDMANDLVIITGKFPLQELNNCLTTSGYVMRMVDQLQRGLLTQEPATLPAPLR